MRSTWVWGRGNHCSQGPGSGQEASSPGQPGLGRRDEARVGVPTEGPLQGRELAGLAVLAAGRFGHHFRKPFSCSTFEVEFVTHSSCEGHCYTPNNTSCVEESGMFCFTGFCYSVLVSHRQARLPLQDATRARRHQPAAGLVPLQLFPLDKDIGT